MISISFFGDFTRLLAELIIQLYTAAQKEFYLAFFTGIILAGGTWWLARYVTFKFNRRFFYRLRHHCLSGAAALVVLCCTLLFFALRFTGNATELVVTRWESILQQDASWSNETFRKTYETIYELRDAAGKQLEDFTGKPHPDSGQSTVIPASNEQSRQLVAQIYTDAVVGHFSKKHPLLSKILWADPKEANNAIYNNMKQFFATATAEYPVHEVVQTAKNLIRKSLIGQIPRVALISRIALVIFVLLTQTFVFSLLIYLAVTDIKLQSTSRV